MKGKYFKRIGGFVFAALMLAGVAFASSSTAEAQVRRRVIVRSYPYRIYRPTVGLLPLDVHQNAIETQSDRSRLSTFWHQPRNTLKRPN